MAEKDSEFDHKVFNVIHGIEGVVDVPENEDDYSGRRGAITYYCRDCHKLITPKKHKKKAYRFVCSECEGENVAWGTEASINAHFRLK